MARITVCVSGQGGQRGHTVFPSAATGAACKTFLDEYSEAGITGASSSSVVDIEQKDPGATANVDRKAIITGKVQGTGEIIKIVVPCPVAAKFPTTPSKAGYRITTLAGQTCIDDWKTANGRAETIKFTTGVIVESA